MSELQDINPLTEEERAEVQRLNRGRSLGNGMFRYFCCSCGMPMCTPNRDEALNTRPTCDECVIESRKTRTTKVLHTKQGSIE